MQLNTLIDCIEAFEALVGSVSREDTMSSQLETLRIPVILLLACVR